MNLFRLISASKPVEAMRFFGLALFVAAAFLFLAGNAAGDSTLPAKPPGTLEFTGHNLFGDANGVFHQWRVVDSHLDPAKPEATFATVEIDLKSLDTGIEDRDDHLRNPDFFETETYPTATARAHSFARVSDDASGEAFTLSIDLDLHGVQKTLQAEARRIARTEDAVTFEGTTSLDRTEFGIGPKASRWNPLSPDAVIPIRFEVALPVAAGDHPAHP